MSAYPHIRPHLVKYTAAEAVVSSMRHLLGRSLILLMLLLGLLLAGRPATASADVRQTLAAGEPNLHAFELSASEAKNLSSMSDVTRNVEIDIMPGNAQNLIHAGSSSLVSVALLSSPDLFVPSVVRQETIRLAGAPVTSKGLPDTPLEADPRSRLRPGTPFLCETRDVNHDRLDDLVCFVQISQMDLPPGATTANLVAQTYNGDFLTGEDEIEVVALNISSEIFLPAIRAD